MKVWIKRLALAVLAAILIVFFICAYIMHSAKGSVPVLNYHQINDRDENALTIHTDQFEAQMKYLSDNGYHTITPQDMIDDPLGFVKIF